MRITIHVNNYYDWEPLPENVEVTSADINALRVKTSFDGKWLMRVRKNKETYTTIMMGESDILGIILRARIRDRVVLTRTEAVAMNLSGVIMPHHAHSNWFKKIEIDDDQLTSEHEEFARKLFLPHVAVGHIELEDLEEMIIAYMTPMTIIDHINHLNKHFKIKEVEI